MSEFPKSRFRRLRKVPALRRMVMENRLSVLDFVYPIFVTHGHGIKNIVGPMPGVYQFSLDSLVAEAGEIAALGIPAVLLFGLPEMKNAVGVEAYQPNGIIQQAIKVIKDVVPNKDSYTTILIGLGFAL